MLPLNESGMRITFFTDMGFVVNLRQRYVIRCVLFSKEIAYTVIFKIRLCFVYLCFAFPV